MFSRTLSWLVTGVFKLACRAEARDNQSALCPFGSGDSLARFASEAWWSQTGSNRRPHACKARALPAELWPRNQKTNAFSWRSQHEVLSARLRPLGFAGHASLLSLRGCATRSRRRSVVGLGRLELPTSRLSSARSNQLSYKPLTLSLSEKDQGTGSRANQRFERRMQSHKRVSPGACSSAKKEKRRRRNPANGAQQS